MKNKIKSQKSKGCPRQRSGVKVKNSKVNQINHFLLYTLTFAFCLLPITISSTVYAQTNTYTGLAICSGVASSTDPAIPVCDFNYLLIEGQHIINWLFIIAIPVAIVLFSYAGVLYIIGTQSNRKKANGIFTAAGIGFGIMLIAWISVYTVVNWLTAGNNGSSANTTGITTFLGQ